MAVRRGTSFLIFSRPGAGKSTLLHTMPGPRLITDHELGDDSFVGDPIILPWEEYEDSGFDRKLLTSKTSVVINALDYQGYVLGVSTIRADNGARPVFRSFGLDTLTKIQDQMELELLPLKTGRMVARHRNFDHFGALLDYLQADMEYLHSLTVTRGLTLGIACHADREVEPIIPQLTGQLRKRIARIPDIQGFLRVEEASTPDGEKIEVRILDIKSTEGSPYETKCRRRLVREKWGTEIENPNLGKIAAVASPRKEGK